MGSRYKLLLRIGKDLVKVGFGEPLVVILFSWLSIWSMGLGILKTHGVVEKVYIMNRGYIGKGTCFFIVS